MKRMVQELRETLDEFVSQCDYSALVIECLSDDLAYVSMFLDAVQETHPEAYVLVFSAPFAGADDYVDNVVQTLFLQVESAQASRAERGDPQVPPVPSDLSDRSRPPSERLRGVLQYLAELVGHDRQQVVAVGFLPVECTDVRGYAALMEAVLPIPEVEAWMLPLRIIAYDDRAERFLSARLEGHKAPNVLTYGVDFSTPALTDGLAREAADTSLPVPERMASLLQLAMIDVAHQRYAPALQKYGALHNYYDEQRMPELQAMCLHGAGEVLVGAGQLEAAKRLLQRGIGLAMAQSVWPVLLNLFTSVGSVCLRLHHHEEAESYATSGMTLAAALLNPFVYADFAERKGDALLAQDKHAEALAAYQHCAEVSKNNEYWARYKSVLAKRAEVYDAAGMKNERGEERRRLHLVEELEQEAALADPAKGPPPSKEPIAFRCAAAQVPALGGES